MCRCKLIALEMSTQLSLDLLIIVITSLSVYTAGVYFVLVLDLPKYVLARGNHGW